MSLLPTIEMMNEFSMCLTHMEHDGIQIDHEVLDELIKEYTNKLETLRVRLQTLAQEAMGAEPINLDSPEQLSGLIYSRKVINKAQWKEVFELNRPKFSNAKVFPKSYPRRQFRGIITGCTRTLMRTERSRCTYCRGVGSIQKQKKDNSPYKKRTKCFECKGKGQLYHPTNTIAGLKMQPTSSSDVTALGFATDKEQLEKLARRAKTDDAKEFLTSMVQYNAISVYLNTYLLGLRANSGGDGRVHTQFMQCVARTGRLSSINPNFQNLPRQNTFPIRKVVVSRFEQGKIIKADFAQLEFRVAVELANDQQGKEDIKNGVDVHTNTAATLTAAGQDTSRQAAKSDTFKPLYGGMSGTDAEITYYKWFLDRYQGVKRWHDDLCKAALTKQGIIIPSGRAYVFPNAYRYSNGGVSGATKIKNYPVQGFATADIVPISLIECFKLFREAQLRAVIFLTVHDEHVVDAPPEEVDIAAKLLYNGMLSVPRLLKERYGYEISVPLDVEVGVGDNWMETKDYEVL